MQNQVMKVLFVGTHIDDADLAAAGTIQNLAKKDYEIKVLAFSSGSSEVDARRRKETAAGVSGILGYKSVFVDMLSKEITLNLVEKIVKEAVKEYKPDLVFGHSVKDLHHRHRCVAEGTLSGARSVPNYLTFTGPLEMKDSPKCVYFTFGQEEMDNKIRVIEMYREVYGNTRYFNREYFLSLATYLGQKANFYRERERAPLVGNGMKEGIPYAESFEVERMVNPF
ncbi:MAG: PIG-L family deacetylase [archaeon]|nr:MAG: PIG-L family deacetylase [archaeon]